MSDAPRDSRLTLHGLTLGLNADGSLDEAVGEGCTIHLEQMSATSWWLGITSATGEEWHLNIFAGASLTRRGKAKAKLTMRLVDTADGAMGKEYTAHG